MCFSKGYNFFGDVSKHKKLYIPPLTYLAGIRVTHHCYLLKLESSRPSHVFIRFSKLRGLVQSQRALC